MLGKRIKQLRKNHGYTQKQLADTLNISPSTIAMYESDRRDPDTEMLKKLSNIFNVSTDYLLGEKTPLTQSHLDNTYDKIKDTFGEEANVLFHDISSFDDEEFEKLKEFIDYMKFKKK